MAHLVLSRVKAQVPTPGMDSLRFTPDIVWFLDYFCCMFRWLLFGLQILHCYNAGATEALMKLVIIAAFLIIIIIIIKILWSRELHFALLPSSIVNWVLHLTLQICLGQFGRTCCPWVSLAASALEEIIQQLHHLLALPCFQRGFYNVLLIFLRLLVAN